MAFCVVNPDNEAFLLTHQILGTAQNLVHSRVQLGQAFGKNLTVNYHFSTLIGLNRAALPTRRPRRPQGHGLAGLTGLR
jgi:hypothetical protein